LHLQPLRWGRGHAAGAATATTNVATPAVAANAVLPRPAAPIAIDTSAHDAPATYPGEPRNIVVNPNANTAA